MLGVHLVLTDTIDLVSFKKVGIVQYAYDRDKTLYLREKLYKKNNIEQAPNKTVFVNDYLLNVNCNIS